MDEPKPEMSFSTLRTKKLGRKLSRSISIVGMKFPDRPLISRRPSKAGRLPSRAKKGAWTFELPIIAPDKTQKQVEVHSTQTIAEVVNPVLEHFGLALEENHRERQHNDKISIFKKFRSPKNVRTKQDECDKNESKKGVAVAVLGGSRAPVDPNASASLLDGELLVLQMQTPQWQGRDLGCFLLSEREYASTVGSAIELYAKPMLKAEILTKREYHVLFYHLHCVSEASKSLCERLQSYMNAGLLNATQKVEAEPEMEEEYKFDNSILDEMVQEGFLKASDIEGSRWYSDDKSEKMDVSSEMDTTNDADEVDASVTIPSIVLSNFDSPDKFDSESFMSLPLSAMKCNEYKKRSDTSYGSNPLLFLQWDFIDKPNEGKRFTNGSMNDISGEYDSVSMVKRSSSDSRILNGPESEDIYVSLDDITGKRLSHAATPYESIEELYETIKNQSCIDSESKSNPETKESSEDDAKNSDDHKKPEEINENEIFINQLINGDLMDAYADYLTHGYTKAKELLRDKLRSDEHFAALVEIKKGPAKYSIADYLELPIERLAQYERLAGGDAGARRRGQRLSDLERVQDLFPNDFLALHEHDVVAATAGTLKSKTLLRKRPSLDAALITGPIAAGSPGGQSGPRQFVMEAPCSMAPASAAPHQNSALNTTPTSTPSTPTQDRHLFLFSDLLLVAKSRGNNSFKLKEAVRLSEVWISAGNSDVNFLLGWAGASTPTTYILTYPTQAARDSWFRKIQNALNTQLGYEPKSTNIQILYKDSTSAIDFSKTLSVTPEMTTAMVIRQALQLVQGGVSPDGNTAWGPARDFCLWARASKDSAPLPLIGCERPHAIQMSRIRQTLSNEEGFDLEHFNSKSNPCGMIFELRKINRNVIKARTPLKLFRRSSGRLFGISLVRLCPNGALPAAVLTMLRIVHRRGPQTQGIFRKSANAKALKHLREKVDNAGAAGTRCPELDNAPVLLVASLLKDFLRSLPQPLMCDSLYATWISILGLTSTEKIPSIRSVLLKLPKAHYNLLSHFVALLQAIARKSSINLMCPMNLAVCVGPSLLWPTVPCDTAPKAVPALIELLIVNADILFGPNLQSIFGKGSPEPSASLSLDSGAEESDSLHSVGLSLDSLDLTCRKEKLSLSRDSGLTLSEDDSNSNGGNSPAPRNGQNNNQVLPQAGIQMHQAQRVYAKCYSAEIQNINGLPNPNAGNYDVVRKNNMYAKNPDVDLYSKKYTNDNIYGTNVDASKSIETQQKIYDSVVAQNRYNANFHDNQAIYGTSNQMRSLNSKRPVQNGIHVNGLANNSPSKFLTGFEPEKPPRLGINRANRNAKVYSMHIENSPERAPPNRVFCRAKSSDDLLEKRVDKSERSLYGSKGSQENIYGNLTYDRPQQIKMKFQRNQGSLDTCKLDQPIQSYSRVYGGWEQRILNYTNPNNRQNNTSCYADDTFQRSNGPKINDEIYDVNPSSKPLTHNKQETENPPTSTIFTRKDWSRQASRTKSLDVAGGDSTYLPDNYAEADDNFIFKTNEQLYSSERLCNNSSYQNKCNLRSIDPAHICTKKCLSVSSTVNEHDHSNDTTKTPNSYRNVNKLKINTQKPEMRNSAPPLKTNTRKVTPNSKHEKISYNNKLVHSKSLANIVLHTNSGNNDTIYQSPKYLQQSSPSSSDNSFPSKFSTEYPEGIYDSPYRKSNIDVFCENIYGKMGSREAIYSSDIYTAKPTSVSSYTSETSSESHNNSRNLHFAPPVPPRKGSHNNSLKNLPPVHLINEERKLKSKSVPSIYQEQMSDSKNRIEDNKNSAGVRAPITSYHLGNSEKFILALEDSGTDTESESYV